MRRVASYGFDHGSKNSQQWFHERESLVGQAASANRVIRLKSVPGDYLKVTSGLGEASPIDIVVAPVTNEGSANGVIELGFMRDMEERDSEFMALVADNIGASVQAAIARERLHEALIETRKINEEMQVQQEELRVANEELQQQATALEESQSTLSAQKAELEQTNDPLSYHAELLNQKNDALNLAHVRSNNGRRT